MSLVVLHPNAAAHQGFFFIELEHTLVKTHVISDVC